MGNYEWGENLAKDELWTNNPNDIKQPMKEHLAKDEF